MGVWKGGRHAGVKADGADFPDAHCQLVCRAETMSGEVSRVAVRGSCLRAWPRWPTPPQPHLLS